MTLRQLEASITVDGYEVTITNPNKLLWPEDGITKLIYLEKLIELTPFLIPYCENRFLTTIRYPNGIHGKSFYQKNCPSPIPEFVDIAEQDGIQYVHLNSRAALLWLGNLACLEFHASFDRIDHADYPSEWILDLDPSLPEEPRMMEAASLVGALLASLGIQSVPKTSGATGVQIIVPIEQKFTFEELRKLGHFIGDYLAQAYPQMFTIERLTKYRGTLIYVDYLQHYRGKTIIAPYSTRARAGAPVSTPLTWGEVNNNVSIAQFHLLNSLERLKKVGDLIQTIPPQNLSPVLSFITSNPKS